MSPRSQLISFIAITFSLSILLSLIVGLTGGHESRFIWLQFAAMPIPALAVLIMNSVFKAPVIETNWVWFPLRWLPLALFLMPVVIHMVCLPLMIFLNRGSLPWKPDGLGWGPMTTGGLVFRIIFNAVAGVIIVSLFAFFEEIGWRAWMLPRLIKRFNVRRGVLIGAVIWALWHLPFMLSGILFIKNVPAYWMVLINPFGIIGAGIVLSWFWLKTKNIWLVSIAHGALNNWGQYAFKFMQDDTTDPSFRDVWLLIGVNVSLLMLGVVILISLKNNSYQATSTTGFPGD